MFSDLNQLLLRPIVPRILCVALAAGLTAQIITSMIYFFSLETMQISHPDRLISTVFTQEDLQAALKRPLFGSYVPTHLDEAGVKESLLQLTVVGILFDTSQTTSQVIIRTSSGTEQSFEVGDVLPGGVIIKRITHEGVLIEHDGEMERLNLPTDILKFEAPAKPLVH